MGETGKRIKSIALTGLAAIAVLGTVGGVGALGYDYFVPDTVETTIVGTEVKRYKGHDKYLVFTEDGVFQNTDVWYRLKFDSSDLQGELMSLEDQEVLITKYGWRIPFLSKYDNIIDVELLE